MIFLATSARFTMKVMLTLVLFSYFAITSVSAATVYMTPSDQVLARGDVIPVKVRLDTANDCINAVDITLRFPIEVVNVIDIGRGESVVTLWIEDPYYDNEEGFVRLVGGIPGGYCGRIPGDPRMTNVLAEIIFQVTGQPSGNEDSNEAGLTFIESSQVLLHDGMGSEADVYFDGATLTIDDTLPVGTNEWLQLLREDDVMPEPFAIELVREPTVFGGRYYIIFSTVDKQSGIDHYQIRETDIDRDGYVRGTNDRSIWVRGKSPHILDDQTLNSKIEVKAIDKAGNERLSVLVPDESLREKVPVSFHLLWIGFLGFIIVAIRGVFLMVRRIVYKA
jgi:hypothetical protein